MNLRCAQKQAFKASSKPPSILNPRPPRCLLPASSVIHQGASCSSHLSEARTSFICRAGKGFGPVKPAKPASESQVSEPCPCESGRSYKKCCQPAHTGSKHSATPEAALRARFSAFIKGEEEYIKSTMHPDYFGYHYEKPQAEVAEQFSKDVHESCTKFTYTDLKIEAVEPGSSEDEGYVAFSYKSSKKEGGAPAETTQQRCRFVRFNGKWHFVDYQSYTLPAVDQLVQEVRSEGVQAPAASA